MELSFLTSAARRVGEVRKQKRNGQDGTHPGQRRKPLSLDVNNGRMGGRPAALAVCGRCAVDVCYGGSPLARSQ